MSSLFLLSKIISYLVLNWPLILKIDEFGSQSDLVFVNPIILKPSPRGRPPSRYPSNQNVEFMNEDYYRLTSKALDSAMAEMRGSSKHTHSTTAWLGKE